MIFGDREKQTFWSLAGLNCLLLIFYFFIASHFGFFQQLPVSIFAAPDTTSYLNVADWIAGRMEHPQALLSRPFFYPLLLACIRFFSSSPYAIWMVQFIFWLLAVNLTAWSAYRLSHSRHVLSIVFLLLGLNLSLIGLTFYALTEITVFFLLSLWLFFWSGNHTGKNRRADVLLTLLLSLLTITKPVFQFPLIAFAAYLIWHYRKDYRRLGLIFAAFLPVFAQLLLVYLMFGALTVSNVPAYNLRHYFFVQLYAANQGIKLEDEAAYNTLQAPVKQFTEREIYTFIARHPLQSAAQYGLNIKDNLLTGSSTMLNQPLLYTLTETTNRVYVGLHLLFCALIFYLAGRKRAAIFRVCFPLLLSYWIFFSAGSAYWQGDRLVVTALPLWFVAYSYLLYALVADELPHSN